MGSVSVSRAPVRSDQAEVSEVLSRDPCKDPKRGDVIRSGTGITRVVTSAMGGDVAYVVMGRPADGIRVESVEKWRRWCSKMRAQLHVLRPAREVECDDSDE